MFQVSINREKNVAELCSQVWPLVLLRGIAMAALGGLLVIQPASTAVVLMQFLGAYFLVDGVLAVTKAIQRRKYMSGTGGGVLCGGVELLIGIFIFGQPVTGLEITVYVLVYSVAALAILAGLLGVTVGIGLLRGLNDRVASLAAGAVVMIVAGVLAMIIGAILVMDPGATAEVYLTVLGGFALLGGLVQIASAFQIRNLGKQSIAS